MKNIYVDMETAKNFTPNHVHQYYYRKLRTEIAKKNPDLTKVIFLTGMIHGYRTEGYKVSEIEDCFLWIKQMTGCDLLC